MRRRDFFANSLTIAGTMALAGTDASPLSALQQNVPELPQAPGLTKYVSEFIVNTKYADIPEDVLALGKKSILDGFGLALAGSVSEMGPLVRQYVEKFVAPGSKSSIVGTGMKVPTRFAALANGVFIH